METVGYVSLKGGHKAKILDLGITAALRYKFIHPGNGDTIACNKASMLIKEVRVRYGFSNQLITACEGSQR